MGIADLFRPKYRHSDVRVRTEAVRALTRDDAEIITQIARTDREPSVRRIAIEKIEEAEVLASIAHDESERSLRDLAGHRAAEIWTSAACTGGATAEPALAGLVALGDQRAVAEVAARASKPELRKRALAELRDARALADLARNAAAAEVRLEAISRIDDKDVLRGLAIDSTHKEVGVAAVERISDPEVLDVIAHKAKAKQVRQRARKKATDLEDAQRSGRPSVGDDVKRRRAEHAQILRQIEALGETHEWEKSLETVHAAEAAWQALGTADDAAVEERFHRAVARYQQRREIHDQAVHKVEESRHHDAEARARKHAERLAKEAEAHAKEAEAVAQEKEAEEAIPDPAREARKAEAEARRAERDAKKAEFEAKKAAEAADRAVRAKEDAERGQQIAASLGALIGEMEQVGPTGDVRAIDRVLTQAAKAFEQVGKVPPAERDALGKRYGEIRAGLVIQMKDLREREDWQRWANVPRQEELITEAELLRDAEDIAGHERSALLKDLQQRWKQVGPVPPKKSKELWEKFKATCDQVYDKVKVGRDAEKEKWAVSAAAKEQLIATAEALAESTDWETTAQQLKGLQAQWKGSGPLPRKQGDELWKRFRAACDRFFERRKPVLDAQHAELERNLEAKQALCARVEAIVAAAPGEAGWGKAIGEVKDLQLRWRDIGFVPRKDADAVYARFRAACDALFAKRDDARDAEANARRAEVEGLRGEIEAVTGLGAPGAEGGEGDLGADAVARALAVRAKLHELSGDFEPSVELAGLVDRMLRQVVASFPDAVKGTELDPAALVARREKLIARAEALMPKTGPSLSGAESPAELAAKLKSAMASNALGGLRMDRDPVEVIHELGAEWRAIGPVLDETGEALAARFEQVRLQVLKAHGAEDRPPRRAPAEDAGDQGDRGRNRRDRRDRRDRRRSERGDQASFGEASPEAAQAVLAAAASPAAVVAAPVEIITTDDVVTPEAVHGAEVRPAKDEVSESHVVVTTPTPETGPVVIEPAPSNGGAQASSAPVVAPVMPPTRTVVPSVEAAPRKRSITDPPPPDVVDDAWDADDHRPQATAPEPAPPAAGEMAGDGATEGEGIDQGWD